MCISKRQEASVIVFFGPLEPTLECIVMIWEKLQTLWNVQFLTFLTFAALVWLIVFSLMQDILSVHLRHLQRPIAPATFSMTSSVVLNFAINFLLLRTLKHGRHKLISLQCLFELIKTISYSDPHVYIGLRIFRPALVK